MATQRPPNDPYDPYRSGLSDDIGRPSRFETDMQPDPDLAEGPASSAKIALFALGIALVLGAVFYSLNNTSVHEAQTAPPKSVAQSQPAARIKGFTVQPMIHRPAAFELILGMSVDRTDTHDQRRGMSPTGSA